VNLRLDHANVRQQGRSSIENLKGFVGLSQIRGASEDRTEPYQWYGEGGLEVATKKLAKAFLASPKFLWAPKKRAYKYLSNDKSTRQRSRFRRDDHQGNR
jgi:hypothetical protein